MSSSSGSLLVGSAPRPKSLALTVLVDWSNQDKTDNTLGAGPAGVKSTCHPCWLCVHFGPPPGSAAAAAGGGSMAGQWQLTVNIYSAEKTPLVKKQNESPVPKEGRAILWHGTQPFDTYRYVVVQQHCRFPPALTPRVVALHADRAEPDANALVWVRKTASLKRHKEDSYLKVVRGHIYHLHMTFPDGSLVNQYIAQGWGFTASLFTYKRKRGHINVSPSRAVTQIRANWLDMVEPDPEPSEVEAARQARVLEIREDQEIASDEKSNKAGVQRGQHASAAAAAKRAHGAMSVMSSTMAMGTTAFGGGGGYTGMAAQHAFSGAMSLPTLGSMGAMSSSHAVESSPAMAAAAAAAAAAAQYGGNFGPAPGSPYTYTALSQPSRSPGMALTPYHSTLYSASASPSSFGPASTPTVPGTGTFPSSPGMPASASAPPTPGSTEMNDAPPVHPAKKRAVEEWTVPELNHVAFAPPTSGRVELPDQDDLKLYNPETIDLRPDVDTFVDTPYTPGTATASLNPPTQATAHAGNYAALSAAAAPASTQPMCASDKELLTVFRSLEEKAKIVASDVSSPVREVAVRLTQVLSASGQLGGWRHVEEFMADQEAYRRNRGPPAMLLGSGAPRTRSIGGQAPGTTTGAPASATSTSTAAAAPKGKIEALTDDSEAILRAAFMRAKWVLEVEKKAGGKAADGKTLERILGVLLKDGRWMSDSAGFLKVAEQQVSSLIGQNPALFAKFRDLQSRGVQWPHSPNLRRQIERAGFIFRPMMIKRDRCVCDACGVEVSGWRPWHNPWLRHDWSKRHPFAPPPGTPGIVSRSGLGFTAGSNAAAVDR